MDHVIDKSIMHLDHVKIFNLSSPFSNAESYRCKISTQRQVFVLTISTEMIIHVMCLKFCGMTDSLTISIGWTVQVYRLFQNCFMRRQELCTQYPLTDRYRSGTHWSCTVIKWLMDMLLNKLIFPVRVSFHTGNLRIF